MAHWRAWLRRDLVGWLLVAIAVVTRTASRAKSMTTFDAGLHAMGLVNYDIPSGQPHPPGYPLVMLAGRVVKVFVGDPLAAMVWLSILCTAVAVFLLWRLGERIGGRWAGVGAATLFILSPMALFNGSVGLTYAAEAATSTAAALAAWRAGEQPSRNRLLVLGVVLAVAVGVRPSSLLFLAPLGLWPALLRTTWRERGSRIAWVAAAAAPTVLVWLVPMLAFGGGVAAVLSANRVQTATVILRDTVFTEGWPIVLDNLRHLAHYARYELHALPWLLCALIVALAFGGPRVRARLAAHRIKVAFLALWMAPALLFYALIYVGWPVYPSGYLMVILPAVALAVAAPTVAALRLSDHGRRRWAGLAVVALVAVPLAFAPSAWSHATEPIRAGDAWAASWDGFEDIFPANETALVAFESWQHIKLRNPEYLAWVRARYDHREDETYTRGIETQGGRDSPRWFDLLAMNPETAPMHEIPPWVKRIVVHEGHPGIGPETIVKDSVALNETTIATGRVVRWFVPNQEWRAIESYFDGVDPEFSESRLRAQRDVAG
ncbi:MAG: glycosyltransferase family 39 protein [Candidatus Thermoplasmatota archaeon]